MDLLKEMFFYWDTDYEHSDNMETMDEFLNCYLPEDCNILEIDGTYAEVEQNGVKVGINSSGNGDFRKHKVEFVEVV